MKAKDWAVQQGYCKAGRGRMPREAHAAIQKAIAGGMTFSDYKGAPAAKGTRVAVPKESPVVEKESPKDQAEGVNVYADAFMRYPMDQQFTYTHEGKTYTINGRGVCMPCGYSLVGHGCNSPVVLTKHGAQPVKPKGE